MSEMQIFEKAEFGKVRIVERDGQPWFVAKDVCECLELTDVSKTISLLDDDEKGTNSIRTANARRIRTRPVFPHPPFPQAGSQGVQTVGDA